MRWKDTCRMLQCEKRGVTPKKGYSLMNIDTTQTRIGVMILSTTITKAIADELRLYDIDYVTMSINVDQTVCASPACPAAHGHQKRNRICSKTNGGFWTCHCQNLSEIHESRITLNRQHESKANVTSLPWSHLRVVYRAYRTPPRAIVVNTFWQGPILLGFPEPCHLSHSAKALLSRK